MSFECKWLRVGSCGVAYVVTGMSVHCNAVQRSPASALRCAVKPFHLSALSAKQLTLEERTFTTQSAARQQ